MTSSSSSLTYVRALTHLGMKATLQVLVSQTAERHLAESAAVAAIAVRKATPWI